MSYIFNNSSDLQNYHLFSDVIYVFDEMQNDQNWEGQSRDHLLIKEIMQNSDNRKCVDYWRRMGGTNHQIIGKIIRNNYNLIANQIYSGNVKVRYVGNTDNSDGIYEVI